MSQQVTRKQTPITMADYAVALVRAWRADLGKFPAKESAGVLWAQYMIETGGKACFCNNVGNVKHVDGDGFDWFDLPGTWEIVNGKRVVLPEGDPGRRFRAYPSLDVAMAHHLKFLRNRRYAPAWPAVEAGNPVAFAHRLGAAGYFTADPEAYAKGMLPHFTKWMKGTAYEDAVRAVVAAQDAETARELPDVASEPEPAIVHPRVPLRGDPPPDDDGNA